MSLATVTKLVSFMVQSKFAIKVSQLFHLHNMNNMITKFNAKPECIHCSLYIHDEFIFYYLLGNVFLDTF